jgi:hypothetical protein
MMINKSKLAFIAGVALANVAAPVFAQAATTTHHRHYYAHRAVYDYRPDTDYRANARYRTNANVMPAANPADDPAMTGGGSLGYNACTGHARC